MKTSDLVKKLQKEIEVVGDRHLLSYKVVDEGGGFGWFRLSLTRTGKTGGKLKMRLKEFRDWVLDARARIGQKENNGH